ncbi:hypothetical protein [Salegentibacter chungangensis]|uniref:Uncharacterized protein n=1 Tax=Salegentibacter chungangensis TaxID=1335724 RepID=A0ABW3NLW8_9FLAO
MKFVIYTVIMLALILIGYNITIIDFDNIFQGTSAEAVIAIVASLIVIVLMIILLVSRTIAKKHRE